MGCILQISGCVHHDDVMEWNEKAIGIAGPLCGEPTRHWWIPLTKDQSCRLSYFFDVRLEKPLSKRRVTDDMNCHGTDVTSLSSTQTCIHKQFWVYLWCYVTYQHLTCILDLSIKQVCSGWGSYHDNHYHWKHGHTHDDVHVNIEKPKAAQHRHDTPTGGKRWKQVLITSWNETS